MAFCPRLPTATESNCIRSLYLCLRQVWERSCVHPHSYLWCFRPPGSECETKMVLPLSTTSADNPAASCGLGRPLPLLQADVGDNVLAYTWTRGPHLARRALKHSWLGGLAAAIKARAWSVCGARTPPPRQELAARKGSGSEGPSQRFLAPLWYFMPELQLLDQGLQFSSEFLCKWARCGLGAKKGEHLAWNSAWRDSQSKCAWLPV